MLELSLVAKRFRDVLLEIVGRTEGIVIKDTPAISGVRDFKGRGTKSARKDRYLSFMNHNI